MLGGGVLSAHVLAFQLSQAGTLNLNLFQTPKSREEV